MRIMITGGGTGGHTSPAVAIIEELQKRDPRLVLQWAGRANSVEQRICENLSLPFRALTVEGWPRKDKLRKLWVGVKLAWAMVNAALCIRKFRPQLVLGVGGYVSVPLVWVAQRMGVPTVLHEQNKRLGMANRILARRASLILLSYPETVGDYPRDRAQVVGNPVRAGFLTPPERNAACQTFGLNPEIPVILVCGGSQGARTLNTAMAQALASFNTDEVQFLWMAGGQGAAEARATAQEAPVHVTVFSFIDDMVSACAAADLIISRSGASSTAELACLGKPSILIPFPFATDNHQEDNGRAFEEAGASIIVLDKDFSGDRLVQLVRELLSQPERLEKMAAAARAIAKPSAVETVVETVLPLAFGETNPST